MTIATKTLVPLLAALLAVAMPATAADQAPTASAPAADPLFDTIAVLDTAVFDAFNTCDQPGRLQMHAAYFDSAVEFYHDTGGVTWSREDMLANTKKHVCGNFRRELIPGSLKVFPIKDFGAIAQGSHRFCQFASGNCEGLADFTIVWRLKDGAWQITRVLSYGHRANR